MNWVDLAILAIVGLSTAFSLVRGFVRETIVFIGLIAGLWAAFNFMDVAGGWFERWIEDPSIRLALGFVVVLGAVLIASGILSGLLRLAVNVTGLTGTDRVLGGIFGAARGAIVVAALVLLADLTDLRGRAWWQESTMLPVFESAADEIRRILPEELAAYFGRDALPDAPKVDLDQDLDIDLDRDLDIDRDLDLGLDRDLREPDRVNPTVE